MKYVELKDLTPGDNIILAWFDNCTKKWWPYNVCVVKSINVEFCEVDDEDEIISYVEFHYLKKGFDSMGNKIIEIGIFDSVEECEKWCNFENSINSEYYDCGYDTRTGLPWGENE